MSIGDLQFDKQSDGLMFHGWTDAIAGQCCKVAHPEPDDCSERLVCRYNVTMSVGGCSPQILHWNSTFGYWETGGTYPSVALASATSDGWVYWAVEWQCTSGATTYFTALQDLVTPAHICSPVGTYTSDPASPPTYTAVVSVL